MTLERHDKEGSQDTSGITQHRGSYRVYVSTDYPKPVRLPEMKRWVSDWTEEFDTPPIELHLSPTIINQRTIDRLHELGVTTIKPIGGVLAWEVHIGPIS
jgi:hypothetical protein